MGASVTALIAGSLVGDDDDEGAWEAIWELRRLGTQEVFDAAVGLLRSSSAKHRGRGVDILAQLESPMPRAEVLFEALRVEREASVLRSLGVAFGHLRDARAVEAMAALKRHEDANVRHGVVMAMSGHADAVAIEALVELSADVDDEVRNWATFALGHLTTVDTPALRRALTARLGDVDDEIRGEALGGLALRGDASVLEQLRRELIRPEVIVLFIEAAGQLGDASLLPLVAALRGRGDAYFNGVVEDAIASTARASRR